MQLRRDRMACRAVQGRPARSNLNVTPTHNANSIACNRAPACSHECALSIACTSDVAALSRRSKRVSCTAAPLATRKSQVRQNGSMGWVEAQNACMVRVPSIRVRNKRCASSDVYASLARSSVEFIQPQSRCTRCLFISPE